MSDHIPHEILIEILSRLPVKTLLRFTSVSKPWQALITNPSFITTHLNQTTQNPQNQPTHKSLLRVYTNTDKKEHYYLLNDENPGDEFEFVEMGFPFRSKVGYFRIVGSCNGLMCLCDDYFNDAHTTLVWNPSVRKSVALPEAKRPQGPHMFVLGFGFDSKKANEFKVVRVVYEKDPMGRFRVPPRVEVYSQGALSWRELNSSSTSVISCCMVEFVWSQAFVNGAVHWVAHDASVANGRFMNMIMMFDMGDEVFKEMSLPPVLAEERPACLSVASFGGGSLAVLCGGSDVWVMKEYGVCESWTKLYSVQLPDVMDRVLGFRKNGEVLLSTRDNWFISYDPETKEISNTGISGSSYSFKVEPYMETLLLLNGPERVQLPEGRIE